MAGRVQGGWSGFSGSHGNYTPQPSVSITSRACYVAPTNSSPDFFKIPPSTPTHSPQQKLVSTADTPNRQSDKRWVESKRKLPEFGNFRAGFRAGPNGVVFGSKGYNRIVYGDHGPYVEFLKEQVDLSRLRKNQAKTQQPLRYYDEWFANVVPQPAGGASVMLYEQLKRVDNQPNPPPGAHSVPNNRSDGYADYNVGCFYVDCYDPNLVIFWCK